MVIESKLIALQNPWWEDPGSIERDQHLSAIEGRTYRYRPSLVDQIRLEQGDISIIRGPRQVGKTTALKMMIKDLLQKGIEPRSIFYFSCESCGSFQELESALVNYLKNHRQPTNLFLDEISFVPEWQRALLAAANMGLTKTASLVLTGSNTRDLKESSERLPGRRGGGKDFQLYPLGLREMTMLQCFRDTPFEALLEIYFKVGGFPRAISDFVAHGFVTDETYDIYRNWIIGDASRYGLRQETLKQILFRIAETLQSRMTWPKLIENSPVRSHETALEYVEHLQDSFLCRIHYCFDPEQHGPAFQKARKLYFIDPLLDVIALCWRDGISNMAHWFEKKLKESSFRGRCFEQAVIHHAGLIFPHIYFWYSSKQKKEVDLIIREETRLRLYDVKLSRQKSYRAINQIVEILDPPAFKEFLDQNGPRDFAGP